MGFTVVMNKLQEFELALSDLYRWFSDSYRSDDDISKAFSRLGLQEANHANLIGYQKKLSSIASTAFLAVEIDLCGIDGAIAEISRLRNSGEPPSVTEAIELSLRLEQAPTELIYRCDLTKANPSLKPFIAQLVGNDRGHRRLLQSLLKRRAAAAS